MENINVSVFVDENGMHQIRTEKGDVLIIGKTVVKQEVDQARSGRCTVIVVFENVVLEPHK